MSIGLLQESALHAALKRRHANDHSEFEVALDGYVIDLVQRTPNGGVARLIEIQTGNFAHMRDKLRDLVERYPVHLVHPIAVDTWKPAVAEKAFEHGAEIINDMSGLTWAPELARVVVQHDGGLILNHMRGTPETWGKMPPVPDLMDQVLNGLGAAAHRANRGNIDRKRILLDPGLGFGKRKEHNIEILGRLEMFKTLDLPILIGITHKAFLVKNAEEESDYTAAAAIMAAILSGAHAVRVHDVAMMKHAVQLADTMRAIQPLPPPIERKPDRPDSGPLADRTKMRPPLAHDRPPNRRPATSRT